LFLLLFGREGGIMLYYVSRYDLFCKGKHNPSRINSCVWKTPPSFWHVC